MPCAPFPSLFPALFLGILLAALALHAGGPPRRPATPGLLIVGINLVPAPGAVA